MSRKPTKPPRDGEEYRFKIGAYTPAKIPMQRLAEYMQQLAQILGEPMQVHFRRLARGSTVLVAGIESEAAPKVRDRIVQVKRGEGPVEARRAYVAVNRLLREDNANGSLRAGAIVLPFPGRDAATESFGAVRQQGFVDGRVISVSGRDKTAHIMLMIEDKAVSGFYTTRAIAKQLAKKWDEAVRLVGRGRWQRDAEGIWTLIDFKVEGFEPLEEAPLSTVLGRLRAIPTEWDDSAYSDLQQMRNGPRGDVNGGD